MGIYYSHIPILFPSNMGIYRGLQLYNLQSQNQKWDIPNVV